MVDKSDYLPTFLVKMTEWTKDEFDEIKNFFDLPSNESWKFEIVSNPINPVENYLPPEFYTGQLPEEISDIAAYNLWPTTDNRPYFNFLRKHNSKLTLDSEKYVDRSSCWKTFE